jgi:hypothetical protein
MNLNDQELPIDTVSTYTQKFAEGFPFMNCAINFK